MSLRGVLSIATLAIALPWRLSAQGAAGADWPCWRGAERNGISRETGWTRQWGTAGPAVLWRAAVGKGFSSFAVAEGRVFTLGNTDNTDTVSCLEAATGKTLWQHRYPCELQPLSYEGGPSATPAVAQGRVFTFSKSGDLFCLDTASGKVLWTKQFALWPWLEGDWKNTWRYAGSPLVLGDRLILSVGQWGLALKAADGSPLWESPAGHPGYSSPVPYRGPGDVPALAFFSGHAAVGADAATGKPLWKIPWNTLWDLNAADPIILNGRAFLSSGNNVGCAQFDLLASPPRELWRHKNLRTPMNGAVLWQGCLFGFDETRFVCLDWETGQVKWAQEDLRRGSVILADARLIILDERGKLVIAAATGESYQPLAEANILSGRCWTAPVLAQGRLYARNAAGDVVCLNLAAHP
jgi:outer membrane protein assembly factor BamB